MNDRAITDLVNLKFKSSGAQFKRKGNWVETTKAPWRVLEMTRKNSMDESHENAARSPLLHSRQRI